MLDELGLGLGPTVEKVYVALLRDPDSTVATLSESLGLNDPEVRAALDELATLALVRSVDGRTRPVDPQVGLATLLARQQAEVARRHMEIEQSRLAVEQWLAVHSHRHEGVDVERIYGVDAVRTRIEEFARGCRDEVVSFNPGGAQSAESLARSRPLNEETLRRGVRMRAIFLDSVRNDRPTVEHTRWLTDLGGQVRTVPVLPIRMIVADQDRALVPIDETDSSAGSFLMSGRALVAGLVALFDTTWATARPLGDRPSREPGLPSEQERQALTLWVRGCTDAMVATRLGVSERTVRRMSDSLSQRLRARSRFEVGARAVELGWLTPADLG